MKRWNLVFAGSSPAVMNCFRRKMGQTEGPKQAGQLLLAWASALNDDQHQMIKIIGSNKSASTRRRKQIDYYYWFTKATHLSCHLKMQVKPRVWGASKQTDQFGRGEEAVKGERQSSRPRSWRCPLSTLMTNDELGLLSSQFSSQLLCVFSFLVANSNETSNNDLLNNNVSISAVLEISSMFLQM